MSSGYCDSVRPGWRVERPYPGLSSAMIRTPRREAAFDHSTASTLLPGRP